MEWHRNSTVIPIADKKQEQKDLQGKSKICMRIGQRFKRRNRIQKQKYAAEKAKFTNNSRRDSECKTDLWTQIRGRPHFFFGNAVLIHASDIATKDIKSSRSAANFFLIQLTLLPFGNSQISSPSILPVCSDKT
jgi:hypothetical protein